MNIFVLDYDTKVCAQMHCDKHCVKMILETAQLLCGVHHMTGGEAPYGLSHKNHPCLIWARECIENYVWLCDLGIELCKEYTHRYGKIHSCQTAMNEAEKIFEIKTGKTLLCHKKATPFAFAGPDEFKHDASIDILTKYKRYIASKPWAASNYLRDPSKKPSWL